MAITYLIGFIAIVTIVVLQFSLQEASLFLQGQKNTRLANNPLLLILKNQVGIILKVIILYGLSCGINYLIMGYLVILLTDYIHYARDDVMRYASFAGILGMLSSVFCGWCSDCKGRKHTLITYLVFTLVSAYALFYTVSYSIIGMTFALILDGLIAVMSMSILHVYISELFPSEVRATSIVLCTIY